MEVSLPGIAATQLTGFILVLCRVGGLFVLAPIFSGRMIPARVKLMLAAAVALALTPLATQDVKVPGDAADLAVLIVKELGVGLAFAFAIAAIAAAVQAGAALIDTIIGFSFSGIADPMNGQQSGVVAQFYGIFATMIFLALDGHHLMIQGLARSYDVLPLLAFPDVAALSASALALLANIFVVGLQIAAPVILALVLTDAAFGIVARAVPQMNVFVVGLPAKIVVGFAVLSASLPFVANRLDGELQSAVFAALRALQVA
jgi:flagellar biosynthetic protein FliR